jgi:hypothetical protein
LARFRDGAVGIPLVVADLSYTGSTAAHHSDDVPGTERCSRIATGLGERLMREVVDRIFDFKDFEVQRIRVCSLRGSVRQQIDDTNGTLVCGDEDVKKVEEVGLEPLHNEGSHCRQLNLS